MDMRFPPPNFCIHSLLPEGLAILGGAPKAGKSWLVLDWCIHIAKGEPVWDLPCGKGTTLYLCLEDPLRRIQDRLNTITDEVPSNAFFVSAADTLGGGLREQISQFLNEHPDTVLVVIDTFQMIRDGTADPSYSRDYQELSQLKQLAEERQVAILLVHHLRKQGDNDPLNRLSGTTGISGSVDSVFVLTRSSRCQDGATLTCTGRDIPYRELQLQFSRDRCVWALVADSYQQPELLLPCELADLISFLKERGSYIGGNTELAEQFAAASGHTLSAKQLKHLMNKWRPQLEQNGVLFFNHRSNGKRYVEILYREGSDASADE